MTTATASGSSSAARSRWALMICASCKGWWPWLGLMASVLGPEPKTEGGRQLRLFLEPGEAVTADAMVVKGSYRALAKEIGAEVDSGGALKAHTGTSASSAFEYPSSPRRRSAKGVSAAVRVRQR